MDELKQTIEDDEKIRADMPWYKRIPLNIFDFLLYRIFFRIPDWSRQAVWRFQRITNGHSDCDVWGLNSYIVEKIRPPLKDFVKNYEERGMSIPMDFTAEEWLVVLKKIEFSFDAAWMEENDWENDPTHSMTPESLVEYHKRVGEGFELFGRHMLDLWD